MKCRRITIILMIGIIFCNSSYAKEEPVLNRQRFIRDCVKIMGGTLAKNWNPLITNHSMPVVRSSLGSKDLSTQFDEALARWFLSVPPNGWIAKSFFDDVNRLKTFTYWGLTQAQKDQLLARTQFWKEKIDAGIAQSGSDDPMDWRYIKQQLEKIEVGIRSNIGKPERIPQDLNKGPIISGAVDIRVIAAKIQQILKKYSLGWKYPSRLTEDVVSIILGTGYHPGQSVTASNSGLVSYYTLQLSEDPQLFSDAIEFYSKLRVLDGTQFQNHILPLELVTLFHPASTTNVWSLALSSTDQDVIRALRVLGVFGHDDQAMQFFVDPPDFQKKLEHEAWPAVINAFAPYIFSSLYQNGALEGLAISASLQKRFHQMALEYDDLVQRFPNTEMDSRHNLFRSGNYHFIGGALLTTELFIRGHDRLLGFNLPVAISEISGAIYKRLTMETDYLQGLAKDLYRRGYPRKFIKRPDGVSEGDFEYAKFNVRINLLHLELTQEQHRLGAEWAYSKLKKNK